LITPHAQLAIAAVGAELRVRQSRSLLMTELHGPPGAKHEAICGAFVGEVSCPAALLAVRDTTVRITPAFISKYCNPLVSLSVG